MPSTSVSFPLFHFPVASRSLHNYGFVDILAEPPEAELPVLIQPCTLQKLCGFFSWAVFLSCIKIHSDLVVALFSDNWGVSGRARHVPLPISEMEKGAGEPVPPPLGSAEAHQLMLHVLHTGVSAASWWPACVCNTCVCQMPALLLLVRAVRVHTASTAPAKIACSKACSIYGYLSYL